MLNILKLKGKIAENGLNMTSLAKKIGMNKDTLYRKVANDGGKLNLSDVESIADALCLSDEDIYVIFFKDRKGSASEE